MSIDTEHLFEYIKRKKRGELSKLEQKECFLNFVARHIIDREKLCIDYPIGESGYVECGFIPMTIEQDEEGIIIQGDEEEMFISREQNIFYNNDGYYFVTAGSDKDEMLITIG